MRQGHLSALLRGFKNASLLLLRGEWREFMIRLRISLGHVDLKQDPEEYFERTHYYVDSGGLEFDEIMSHFHITPNDAIIDFGCGKGGVLISLSKYPFSKITGIEISPEMVEVAISNIESLKINNIEIIESDAAEVKDLDIFNYFYFFNPFPCIVMKEVVDNIKISLLNRNRKIIIIYLNPTCHEEVIVDGVFAKIKEVQHFLYDCYIYSNYSQDTDFL